MANTTTTNRLFINQEVGANDNTWGNNLNANWERLDNILGDTTTVNTAGGTTALTDDQQDVAIIEITGTLVSNADIEFDGRGGTWLFYNNTSGAFSVTAKVTGQTGVAVTQGEYALIYSNGTDIVIGLGEGLSDIVFDLSPQLGGHLDPNSFGVSAAWNPSANDGAALGTTALQWSDLFLASGSVVNWDNGDVTLTHSANLLTFAGATSGYDFDAPITGPTYLELAEQSTAPTAGAGVAILYALNTAPTTLGLVDDADTELLIAIQGTTAVGVGKHTFWMPIGAMADDDGSPPLRETVVGTTSGQQVPVASFDAASTETLWFHVYMPKSWAAGTLTPVVVWMPSGTSTGNCLWRIDGVCFGDSDPDAAPGTDADALDAGAGTALDFQFATAGALTIAAAAAEELCMVRVRRMGAEGTDTFTGDAHLIGVAFVYTTDQATDD